MNLTSDVASVSDTFSALSFSFPAADVACVLLAEPADCLPGLCETEGECACGEAGGGTYTGNGIAVSLEQQFLAISSYTSKFASYQNKGKILCCMLELLETRPVVNKAQWKSSLQV